MDKVNELNERITSLRSRPSSKLISVYLNTYQGMVRENLTKCTAKKYECEIRRNCLLQCFDKPVTEENYSQVRECYNEHNTCWMDIRDGQFTSTNENKCNGLRKENDRISC